MLPINRSQKAFAVGACGGDFNTSIPQRATSSSKPTEKVFGGRAAETCILDLRAAIPAAVAESTRPSDVPWH